MLKLVLFIYFFIVLILFWNKQKKKKKNQQQPWPSSVYGYLNLIFWNCQETVRGRVIDFTALLYWPNSRSIIRHQDIWNSSDGSMPPMQSAFQQDKRLWGWYRCFIACEGRESWLLCVYRMSLIAAEAGGRYYMLIKEKTSFIFLKLNP